jgi:NADPH-dependent 2,4-dienoyl-CoA reductase/sulfur reductase-like enzyme
MEPVFVNSLGTGTGLSKPVHMECRPWQTREGLAHMSAFATEVLIIGAGPVGLTMAAELARHGVRSRIIDQPSAPLPFLWDDMGSFAT